MKYLVFIFLFVAQISYGQSKSLTKVINKIEYESDTLLAVYNWVTDNIKYDAARLKNRQNRISDRDKAKFKTKEAYRLHKLETAIRTKKGVCQEYSLIFHEMVKALGYRSHIVSGIVKNAKGRVVQEASHAWVAVKTGGEWKFYDPTWGAGFLDDRKKFIKKYTTKWYEVSPEEMIERHFPFDPFWQLLPVSITYDEFKNNLGPDTTRKPVNVNQQIDHYLSSSKKEQQEGELRRSIENGGNFRLIIERRRYLEDEIANYDNKNESIKIGETFENMNQVSQQFSAYINAKNKRFKDKKWNMEYSLKTLKSLVPSVEASIETLNSVNVKDSKNRRNIKKSIKQSEGLLDRIHSEIEFLEERV